MEKFPLTAMLLWDFDHRGEVAPSPAETEDYERHFLGIPSIYGPYKDTSFVITV